jgi:ribose 5-phosphate isomerase B
MKIYIASDHAAFGLKSFVMGILKKKKIVVADMGPYDEESVDYPDYAKKVARKVSKDKGSRGILSCGTGIGMSMTANKVRGIRAALVRTPFEAEMSRKHNDSNILVFGGRPFNKANVTKVLNIWLTTKFEGGRHLRRVRKIG